MTGKKLQRVLACLLAVLLLSQVGAFSPAVFAADDSDYTLQDGTAIIKSTMTTDEVNYALTRALVKDFDQKSEDAQAKLLEDLKWEYECEGKAKVGITKNKAWGLIEGFTSTTETTDLFGKVHTTNYNHPALKDNSDGSYQVRVAGTETAVTLTKAEKLSSSITLKQGVSVKLPYKEDGTLDFDALRENIFSLVVESTTPDLTVNDVTIEYHATATKGAVGELGHAWVSLEGEKVGIYEYPAISEGNQQIRISYAGNDTYGATSAEVTVTFADRADSNIVLKSDQQVALPYVDATTVDYDALRAAILAQVVDASTPVLTTENTEIKYKYATVLGEDIWADLEGGTVASAVTAKSYEIQISFKGDDTYKASSATTTVTFTERPSVQVTQKENPTFKLAFNNDGAAIYDSIQQQVFDAVIASTDPALTADDVTIEYYATVKTGSAGSLGKAWMPLEGGEKNALTYPAIGEGTQQVRISYPGSRDYAPFTIKADVVVTGRADAPFQLKEGVTEVAMVYNKDQSINYEATAQALREALLESTDANVSINDVTVEYEAAFGAFEPLDYKAAMAANRFGTGEQTIRFTWRGNADYKGYTEKVDIEMTDNREASAVVLKQGVSLVYNKDAAVMKQQIFDYVIDWDDSTLPDKSTLSVDDFTIEYYATAKVVAGDLSGDMSRQGWAPIEGKGVTLGKLQLLYPQMGAGEQQIRVTFNGSETYRPSKAVEGPLTVKKANVSVKVHSTSIYADEVPGEGFVTTDPVDDFDIFTIYTGVSSVFVQLPTRFTDNAFIKVVDPVLKSVGLRTIQDIMDKGITVGELKENLYKIANDSEYAAVREALKLMGVDVTTLQQIINVFNKITLLDNVRIALRTPDQVGIYTVYAITNNDNYNTGFGMGALVVKKHYSGVKLDWNQNFTDGKISAADVENFDFNATLYYNGEQVEDQSSVHYLYSGFTSKWKPYSSTTTPPTEPGRYVVTVVTLGGNYQAAPITRAFQITK